MPVTIDLNQSFALGIYHIDVKWIKTRESVEPSEIIKLLKQDKNELNKALGISTAILENENEKESDSENNLSTRGSDSASADTERSDTEENEFFYRPLKKTTRNKGKIYFRAKNC
jgi:hypothetical protein